MKLKDRFNAFLGKNINIQNSNNPSDIKSGGMSEYVRSQLSGYSQFGGSMSPSMAYWLWEKSDTVGDCVDRIAMAFQGIQPALKDKKTGDYLTKPSDHPFLALLDKPGFLMDSTELMYTLMTSFLVVGAAYPILQGNVKYEPSGVYTIPGNKVSLTPDSENLLHSISFTASQNNNVYNRKTIPKRNTFVYQSADQLSETLQILVSKRRHGIEAQSILDRIYYQTLTKYFGNIHNSSIMQQGSRPSGLWSSETPCDQEQFEALKNEVFGFEGPENAGKNIVSPVPVKYQNFLLNPRDMDFIQLIENNRTEIYNQFTIPLALVSKEVMTLGNFESSTIAFYDQAVLPRSKVVLKRLGDFALPRYKDGERFELTYDEKALPALKARLFDRADKMSKIYVYSDNEIRSATGYESTKGGDVIYKPANLIDSGDQDDYTDDNQ